MAQVIVSVKDLHKRFDNGFSALNGISLDIHEGEILALLGPNGAGKTTLISAICGLIQPSQGHVSVNGFDTQQHYRQARSLIGLVPQELTVDAFETVWSTVRLSRGLFGLSRNDAYLDRLLQQLSLTDKKHQPLMSLSGGMKRRVMIAKALAHEPKILFLDEPSAGVDVNLRRDMWAMVSSLRDKGVTIILTTHYIEEAEELADRVGIIRDGSLMLLKQKHQLMEQLGQRRLKIDIETALTTIPVALQRYDLHLENNGNSLIYAYTTDGSTGITGLLSDLKTNGIVLRDLHSEENSLEDIFLSIVGDR